jgi:hypothetical protein
MNKITLFLLFLVCTAQFKVAAQSSTVNYSAGVGQPPVWTSQNVPVPVGNTVSIGYFDPTFNPLTNGDDLDGLMAAWHEYGTTSISSIFGNSGYFAGSASSTNSVFDNQKIWLLVFKTSDNSAPNAASDYVNVQEYGLFSGTSAEWTFPAQGGLPPNTRWLYTDQINQAGYGNFSTSHLGLQPFSNVPEPAVGGMLLVGLAVFGVIAKRRVR